LPGILAATLFILENRWDGRGWRYFLEPAAWIAAGTGTAFAANAVYMLGSGNPLYYFSTTFSSPLLWYRLFPSLDNHLGVLADVILYSLPAAALLVYGLSRWKAWHALRLAALGLFLLMFFAGGLVVSAKIGGGNNIHNLDAFFVLLLTIAASLYFGRFAPDRELEGPQLGIPTALIVGGMCLTGLLGLAGRELVLRQPVAGAEEAIAAVQANVDAVNRGGGGEILFMTERQLLSLGMVRGVKLVPEYEKWFLMEMAMGGNQTFYAQFDQAVRSRRFALIVSEPLQLGSRAGRPFEEENNVFMKYVSAEVLANYTAAAEYPQFGFTIYKTKIK
ncbi:MAG TPA: hypothetical protein VF813_02905, partial [Anaerolineaceae bacterium]